MTIAQKHEAVALGRVMGAEAAAEALGWDRRTVRGWMADAGVAPDLADPGDGWQALHDLSIAKTTAAVASGKLPARTVAVIAGIAARNLKPSRPVAADSKAEADADPTPLSTAARHRFTAWIASLPDDDRRAVNRSLHQELNRRSADGDPGPPDEVTDEEGAALWDAIRESMAADLPGIAARVAAADVLEAARIRQREIAGRWLDDVECDLLIEAETYLQQEIQP